VPDIWRAKTVWSATAAPAKKGTDYAGLVERAFKEWSDASGGGVTFTFVANNSQANVECEWTTDQSKLSHSFAAGETHTGVNSIGKRKATAFIVVRPNDPDYDEKDFYSTTLHEVGHAIGLSHSATPADVMYFSSAAANQTRSGLSEGDRRRVRQLYAP